MCIPKVSVIIPVYNTEKYVRQAVESIRRQTLKDIEIIIVNDGSTDGSMTILEELAAQDERIKLFSQENQGLSVTRNVGLSHSTGEYVYFMDSDDLLVSDTLLKCYVKCKEENLDFVFFDAESFNDEGTLPEGVFDYKRTDKLEDKVYNGAEIFKIELDRFEFKSSVCLNIIKREFLISHNLIFKPGILHEDQLFTVMLYLNASKVGFIKEAFFKRRVRNNSIMTNRFAWKNMHGYLTVTTGLLQYASKYPEHKKLIDLFLSQMLDAAVWQAHVLPLSQRIRLFFLCVKDYKKYVTNKTLLTLLLKSVVSGK